MHSGRKSPNPTTFERLFSDGEKKRENQEKLRFEISQNEESANAQFVPNRDKTKKNDTKYNIKKSPERFDNYYKSYVEKKRNMQSPTS